MCAKENTRRYIMDSVALERKGGKASAMATDAKILIALEWPDESDPPTDLSVMIPSAMAIQASDFCNPKLSNLSVVVEGEKVVLVCINEFSGGKAIFSAPSHLPSADSRAVPNWREPNWREVIPAYEIINLERSEDQKNQAVRVGFTAELLQKLLVALQAVMENVDTLGADNPELLVMDVPLYPVKPIVFRKTGQNGIKLSAAVMAANADEAVTT